MKLVLRPALAAGAALALSSCETYPGGGYSEYGGDPGGYSGGSAYYGGGGGYVSRPYYGGGGGYYSSDYYRRNGGRYDRDHDRDHDHDHDHDRNDRGGSSRKNSSDNDIRLTKYREGGKPSDLPSGYHSKEWYQQRGYSLSKNNYVSRDGDARGNAARSSSSSSKKDSGSSRSDRGDKNDKKR